MRRTFLFGFFLVSFTLVSSSRAQLRGGLAPVGSVGRAPIVAPFGRSFSGSGGFRSGYGYGGSYGNGRRGYGYGYGIAAYPVYIGGLSGDYYPGYTDPSLGAQGYGAPGYGAPAAAPPVVINQYFGAPGPGGPAPDDQSNMQVYPQQQPQSQESARSDTSEPRTYLIAYKDHSVYSALAYWIEDHTLNYVTTQNTHNQADLALIDVDFTKKLNQDRNMPFTLTPSQR